MEYPDRLPGLLPGDFDDGHVALLVCPICGDVECGAVKSPGCFLLGLRTQYEKRAVWPCLAFT
jgi:hypothetical protein